MSASNENKALNIFLAEDDDDDYYFFTVVLEDIPINTTLSRAPNGIVLMKMLSDKLPDILFLDLLMPGMDGFQCLREIRKNIIFDKLPVIILSSVLLPERIRACHTEKASRFVGKDGGLNWLRDKLIDIFTMKWEPYDLYPQWDQFVISN